MNEKLYAGVDTGSEIEVIEPFFSDFVEGWMLGDIRYCCAQEKSLAFTVATMVFTGIDFFGGLLTGGKSNRPGFVQFVKDYFAGEYAAKAEDLYKVFRDGLVHQYFPKQQGAIGWSESSPHLTKVLGRYNLNARRLAKDFEGAVARYRQQLGVKPQLRANFMKRLEIISAPPDGLMEHAVVTTSSASTQVQDILRRVDEDKKKN